MVSYVMSITLLDCLQEAYQLVTVDCDARILHRQIIHDLEDDHGESVLTT